jgi:hypothetical protein
VKRDVYYLIFDRYGSDRAYDLLYGLKNDLTPWLREQGFTVLDDSHANYVRTGSSIPTTLNMTHLTDIPGLPGPGSTNVGAIQAKIHNSLVARQFKALGYRYYHVGSRWDPNAIDPAADVNLYLPAPSGFVTALIDATALPVAARRLRLDVSARASGSTRTTSTGSMRSAGFATSRARNSCSATSCCLTRRWSMTATAGS